MRNTMKRSRISTVMTLTLGILMMTLSAPAFAADAVSVVGTSVSGSSVVVSVKNSSLLPQTATINVQAVVNGSTTSKSVSVVLLPLQSSAVNAGFSGTVSSVVRVGLIMGLGDDTVPF